MPALINLQVYYFFIHVKTEEVHQFTVTYASPILVVFYKSFNRTLPNVEHSGQDTVVLSYLKFFDASVWSGEEDPLRPLALDHLEVVDTLGSKSYVRLLNFSYNTLFLAKVKVEKLSSSSFLNYQKMTYFISLLKHVFIYSECVNVQDNLVIFIVNTLISRDLWMNISEVVFCWVHTTKGPEMKLVVKSEVSWVYLRQKSRVISLGFSSTFTTVLNSCQFCHDFMWERSLLILQYSKSLEPKSCFSLVVIK